MPIDAPEQFTRYQLRRTLFPWKFDETITEALEFSRAHGIEEIIWKIDTEEISHGLPTLEVIRSYLPALNESRERLAKAGIAMSINPWVTQGMRDAGWDLRATFPDFEWMTDISGIQAKSQACPLSPAWRQWLADAYEIYASTGPRVLWLEDDFRVHRHLPVTVARFCQRHIRTFSEKMGRPFTRESLAEEILRPGVPSPVRAQWFDFIGNVMCEVVEHLAERVYPKYPKVALGLMCSAPQSHAAERRNWDRMMKALTGHHKRTTIRPCMGNYFETNLRGLYWARDAVTGTIESISRPVHACSELENFPYTRFSKSFRITRSQLLLSAAMRCPSITLNLYDHTGTPISHEPGFGKVLSDVRPMQEEIIKIFPPEAVEKGVRVLNPGNGPEQMHLKPGQNFSHLLSPVEPWGEHLQGMGMGVTWGESPVIAASAQLLRPYRQRIDEFFSKGVLLDVAALETLIDMVGPARAKELTGVTLQSIFTRYDKPTSIEAMTDPEFGGPLAGDRVHNAGGKTPVRHVTIDHAGLTTRIGELVPDAKVRVISQMVNADLQPLLPAFTLYENALGGRVAICPYDLNTIQYPWFASWHRQAQLQSVTNWLFRGQAPLQVEGGAYALPIRSDVGNRVSVAVLNLSLDAWDRATLRIAMNQGPRSVQQLKRDGSWEALGNHRFQGGMLTIESESPIDSGDMAVFKIE